jgi:valyl-tRNA synthetase
MGLVMNVIGAVRNLRSELNIPPAKKVELILHAGEERIRNLVEGNRLYIENLARTAALAVLPGGEKPKGSATAIVEAVEVFLPLKGIIDLEEEEKRIQRELKKIGEDLSRTNLKLHNRDFLERAKAEAVAKEKEKVKSLSERDTKLKESLARVQGWRKEV